MKPVPKKNLPVAEVRRYLEPGPVVLVSSAYKGERNVMTMGWHLVMEFTPSRLGCVISPKNHSYDMIRRSKECVINVPTVALVDEVVGIGNTTGADIDKLTHFGLTAVRATKVKAPLIGECFASFECKVVDTSLLRKYSLFILEVVKAHVAITARYPKTIHYRGDGVFMVSGKNISKRRLFRPEML